MKMRNVVLWLISVIIVSAMITGWKNPSPEGAPTASPAVVSEAVQPVDAPPAAITAEATQPQAAPVEQQAAKPHAPSIREGAYEPLTKESASKLYKAWGKAGIARINAAVENAVQLASLSPKCDTVNTGGYSFDRSAPKKNIVVFADCLNGQRFYFTEEEAKATGVAPTSVADALSASTDSQMLRECEDLAKAKMKFPSTFDSSWLDSTVIRNQFNATVTLLFEAKNSFGAMLPYVAYCALDDKKITLQSIKER